MTDTNQLLQMLPASDRAELDRHLTSVQLTQGQVLAEPGDEIRNVYFPHSGIVSFMVALNDGALVQTLMVGRDGIIGASQALDDKKSINKIIVQIPGAASMLDRSPLRDLAAQHPAIRNLLATHEQFLVADIQQTAACNARHSVEARMARWILRMRDLAGDEFSLTQEHLAAMIGVRRAGVTDVAGHMQDKGAISYARGHLRVTDVEALRRYSCECHQAVKDNYRDLFNLK